MTLQVIKTQLPPVPRVLYETSQLCLSCGSWAEQSHRELCFSRGSGVGQDLEHPLSLLGHRCWALRKALVKPGAASIGRVDLKLNSCLREEATSGPCSLYVSGSSKMHPG